MLKGLVLNPITGQKKTICRRLVPMLQWE